MTQISAGLLLYRFDGSGGIEVLLGHMGGPFWARKHEHGWSAPKGLAEDGEDDLVAVAEREFAEEMGAAAPEGESVALGSVKSGKKTIHIFARQGDFDAASAVSNTFTMEWPKGSGTMQEFPEMDKAEWVAITEATTFLTKGQGPFVQRLIDTLAS